MRSLVLVLTVAFGCGRTGFDPTGDARTSSDASAVDGADGGDRDGGVDATAMDLGCASATILCDGLETSNGTTFPTWGAAYRADWNSGALSTATQCTVTTSPVSFGDHAMQVIGNGSAQQCFLRKIVTQRPNPEYVRAMVRFPAADTTATGFDLFGVAGATGGYLTIDVNVGAGTLKYSAPMGFAGMSASVLTPDRWYCVELMVAFSTTAAGEAKLSVDGTMVLDLMGVTDNAAVPYNNVSVGISTGSGETTAPTVFYDDIAISAAPIGCPP